jgi:hypothetical protein
MEKVQRREGLVCICVECKKVMRIVGNVEAEGVPLLSHGICPECAEKLYGDLFRKRP